MDINDVITAETEGISLEEEKAKVIEKIAADYEFLKAAKNNILEIEAAEEKIKKLTLGEKKAKKHLDNAKKIVEAEIEKVWKAGYESACGELTAQVNHKEKDVVKLKNERASIKAKGIADRIAKETEYLHRENQSKKKDIETMYKEDGVPFFCKLRYYFALFAPKGISDLFILVATQLVVFGIIPLLVYYLIPDRTTTHLVIVYVVALLLFGSMYGIILYFTRIRHSEAVKAARELTIQIRANKKQIEAVKNRIERDEDESGYGLADIDKKIAASQSELDVLSERLEAAKNEFETVTKERLKSEVEAKHKETMDALEAEYAAKEQALEETNSLLAGLNTERENVYSIRIPKEYLKVQKINKIMELFESRNAVTIDSAILILKSMGK